MMEWRTVAEGEIQRNPGHRTIDDVVPFGPLKRPAYPILVALDDYSSTVGESLRVRRESLTIGRMADDMSFPADCMMSARHLRIALVREQSMPWYWCVEDLNSTNGLYLRISTLKLIHGMELLIGGTRLLFQSDRSSSSTKKPTPQSYLPYLADAPLQRKPLFKIEPYTASTVAGELEIDGPTLEVGRAAAKFESLALDSLISPIHLTCKREPDRSWSVTDANSLNGVWLRIRKVSIESFVELLAGEQRLQLRIPEPV